MSKVFKDNLDAVLLQCTGKPSDQMSVYELKKWARAHKGVWAANMVLAATIANASEEQIRAALVQNAYQHVGKPYDELDCSDLVEKIYEDTIQQAKEDGSFPTYAAGQAEFCHDSGVSYKTLDLSLLKPGDLIFWAWTDPDDMDGRFWEIDHVGMVMEANGENSKVIEARNGDGADEQEVRIENRVRNLSCLKMIASPVYLYTGQVINEIPEIIGELDKYGLISTSELIRDKVLKDGEIYKYFYCSCELCRSSDVADMTGMPRKLGHMALPPVSQIRFELAAESESAVGDETGTVMSIDGKLYKCVDYSEGRFALSLDTVGLYTEDDGTYTGKIIWSNGTTGDGIDTGESFINDHIDAINRTYAHQIRTSRYNEDYRVLPIDPENLLTAQFDTYRFSGNPASDYVDTEVPIGG